MVAGRRPQIVVAGAGFAGYHCLRTLERLLPPDAADLVAVNPADYMLYVPLLPEVVGGDPGAAPGRRAVADPATAHPGRARRHRGRSIVAARTCTVVDVERRPRPLAWDRLVLACGSVTRLLSVPGVADHAKGFKSIAEAIYLRDHVLRQLELAEVTDDPAERAARCTFVVVGAGYTGTEVVGQGVLLTKDAMRQFPGLSPA